MIYYTIKLHGGLGNQLFMMASIWGLAEKHNVKFVLESWSYGNWCLGHYNKYYGEIFNRFVNFDKSIEYKNTYRIEPYYESALEYQYIPKQIENTQFDGYFQSPKYFSHISGKILKLLLPNVMKGYEKTCIIHLRCGDYKDYPHLNIDLNSYFEKTINKVKSDNSDVKFLITTNDIVGAKQKYSNILKYGTLLEETDILKLIRIMASCEYGVICSNSSFSWWGAYLNFLRNDTVSYAPDPWFKDSSYLYKDIYFENLIPITY